MSQAGRPPRAIAVGDEGVTVTVLRPVGTVRIGQSRVDGLAARAQLAARSAASATSTTLAAIEARLARLDPGARQAAAHSRLDDAARRLVQSAARRSERFATRVDLVARQLAALSPTRVLERGYSITLGADGQPVRSIDRAEPGTELTTVVADGRISSTVTTREKEST